MTNVGFVLCQAMATFISRSPEETQGLGETWGRNVPSGSVIALVGDLGSGKTQLVKGMARGLGCVEKVRSPTFALMNAYAGGRLTLFHLDLYRLEGPEAVYRAGLSLYLPPDDGVTVLEWAEKWYGDERPAGRPEIGGRAWLRWVTLEWLSATERKITYEDIGP